MGGLVDLEEIIQVLQPLNQTLELVVSHQNRTRFATMCDVEWLLSLADMIQNLGEMATDLVAPIILVAMLSPPNCKFTHILIVT